MATPFKVNDRGLMYFVKDDTKLGSPEYRNAGPLSPTPLVSLAPLSGPAF